MNDVPKPREIFGHKKGPGYMGAPPEIMTEPFRSPNGENVVFRLGRFFDGMETGWEQIGHVVMTEEEASDLLNKLHALVGLPAAKRLAEALADAGRALHVEAGQRIDKAVELEENEEGVYEEDDFKRERDRADELVKLAERIGG